VIGHNLSAVFLISAVPVFPTSGLEFSFDVQVRAFAYEFAHNLGESRPDHNVVALVRSWNLPLLSLNLSLVARLNLPTGVPLAVTFTSGSCPTEPSRTTLFALFIGLH